MLKEPEAVPEFDSVTIRHRGRESQCLFVGGGSQTFHPDYIAFEVNELDKVMGAKI